MAVYDGVSGQTWTLEDLRALTNEPLSATTEAAVDLSFIAELLRKFENLYDSDICYTMYTSGSTRNFNVLKVQVPLRCVVSNLEAIKKRLDLTTPIRQMVVSLSTFDPCIIEILLPLTSSGGFLVLPRTVLDPEYLYSLVHDQKINVLSCSPSLFGRFTSIQQDAIISGATFIKTLILGAEAFPLCLTSRVNCEIGLWNIYGTTECSVWASLTRVSDPRHPEIGHALEGVIFKVFDVGQTDSKPSAALIAHGNGQLWIGGSERRCLVGDETEGLLLRPTGDLVHIETEPSQSKYPSILYLGRLNNIVKKSGYRVSLDEVAFELQDQGAPECLVIQDPSSLEFVIAVANECDFDFRGAAERLPLYARPLHVMILGTVFPRSTNDKVDLQSIKNMYAAKSYSQLVALHLVDLYPGLNPRSSESLANGVYQIIAGHLELPITKILSPEDYFLSLGGNSITAIRVIDELFTWIKGYGIVICDEVSLSLLLQKNILHYPLVRLCDDLFKHINSHSSYENQDIATDVIIPTNAIRNAPTLNFQSATSYYKGGCISRSIRCTLPRFAKTLEVDLGKCIDASPLIVCMNDESDSTICYIGSHSGNFCAIKIPSNEFDSAKISVAGKETILWSINLPDRIEASACYIPNANLVCIGCYDGCIYFINAGTGGIVDCVSTGNIIKAMGIFQEKSKLTGYLFIGGYDRNIHRIEIGSELFWSNGRESHIRNHSLIDLSGAIYAACCLDQKNSRVWIATLKGRLVCIDVESMDILRDYIFESPIFATPIIAPSSGLPDCIIITVNGVAHSVSSRGPSSTSYSVWSFECHCPVFSSPICIGSRVYFGSHSSYLYGLAIESGALEFKFALGESPVFSSLYAVGGLLFSTNVNGKVSCLDDTGQLIAEINLDGECFSSPVVWITKKCSVMLAIGCRTNFIKIFKLTSRITICD